MVGLCGCDADAAADAREDEDADTEVDEEVVHFSSCPTSFPIEPHVCDVALLCSMGDECCCGFCGSSGSMQCAAGESFVRGYSSDLCFFPPCSYGCERNEVKTTKGCETCAAARVTMDDIDSLEGSACSIDDDCQELHAAMGALSWACTDFERVCRPRVALFVCTDPVPHCADGHCVAR